MTDEEFLKRYKTEFSQNELFEIIKERKHQKIDLSRNDKTEKIRYVFRVKDRFFIIDATHVFEKDITFEQPIEILLEQNKKSIIVFETLFINKENKKVIGRFVEEL